MNKEDLPLLFWFLGFILAVGGVAMFSPRGALIVAGCVFLRTAERMLR